MTLKTLCDRNGKANRFKTEKDKQRMHFINTTGDAYNAGNNNTI